MRIKPGGAGGGRRQDGRHAVVDGLHHCVGRGGDDGAGFVCGAVGRAPGFPEGGEGEGTFVAQAEEPRFAGAAGDFPFVETAGGNQAAAGAVGIAEGGLFGEGFGAGVDDGGVGGTGPPRREAPVERGEFACAIGGAGAHGGDTAAGGNIVAGGRERGAGGEEHAEGFQEGFGVFLKEDVAAAHGRSERGEHGGEFADGFGLEETSGDAGRELGLFVGPGEVVGDVNAGAAEGEDGEDV